MIDICRLCLNEIPQILDKLNDKQTSQKEKIKLLMPEIDINITSKFALCIECTQSVNSAYEFKSACMQTEDFIQGYMKHMKPTVLDLRDIMKERLYGLEKLVSQEEIKVEINDVDSEYFIDTANIKNEINCPFTCDKCRRNFENFDQYQKHISKECIQIFYNIEELEKDELNISKEFMCIICNKTFGTEFDLKQHTISFHSIEVSLNCDVCDKIFANEKSLKRHALIHSTREKYTCDICGNSYYRLSALLEHKEKHMGKQHTCTICSKSFVGARNLQRHMKNAHFGTHVCDTCGMKCGSKNILEEHMRTHTGERPFKCEICGKGFAQQGTLNVHIRCIHSTDKPFACQICGKTFTLNSCLRLHQETHVAIVDRKFACELCHKMFRTNRNLREHVRRHLGARKHKCSVCSKEFLAPNDLKKHMRTHTGERPFECYTCHKTFSQKYNMQIHFKSHRPKNKSSKQLYK